MNNEAIFEDDILFVLAVTFLLSCAGCFLYGHELAMAGTGSEKRALAGQYGEKLNQCQRVLPGEMYGNQAHY